MLIILTEQNLESIERAPNIPMGDSFHYINWSPQMILTYTEVEKVHGLLERMLAEHYHEFIPQSLLLTRDII